MTTLEQLEAERAKIVLRLASLRTRVTAGDRTVQYDLTMAETAIKRLDEEIRKARGSRRIRAVRLNPMGGY